MAFEVLTGQSHDYRVMSMVLETLFIEASWPVNAFTVVEIDATTQWFA